MMTTLQMILAGVGVLFIVLIVGYNLWQERRYRKEASRMFSSRREDILLGESVRSDLSNSSTQSEQGYRSMDEDAPNPPPRWQDEVFADPHHQRAGEAADPDPGRAEPASGPGMDLGSFRPGKPAHAHDAPAQPLAEGPASRDMEPVPAVETMTWQPEPAVRPAQTPTTPPATPAQARKPGLTEMAIGGATAAPGGEAQARFEAESPLDVEIEYVARLRFTKSVFVSYNTLMDRLRKVGKPVRAMGRRSDGGWDTLTGHPPTSYESLEFGVLLADRNGALTQEQMELFCRALYDFAGDEGGAVSCPDKRVALEKARDLDMFCVDVDVLIGLNVVARDARPFSGEEIDRLATGAGLKLGMDGAYYLEDEDGMALFSIANQEEQPFRAGGVGVGTHGLSLIFDLPRVRDGINVFDRMTTLGRQLADNLGGRLVDDNGRIVTQDSLQKDRKRLNEYFARMQARGIPAGGERALRLFA